MSLFAKSGSPRIEQSSIRLQVFPLPPNRCVGCPVDERRCTGITFRRRPVRELVRAVRTGLYFHHGRDVLKHDESMPQPDRYLRDRRGGTHFIARDEMPVRTEMQKHAAAP